MVTSLLAVLVALQSGCATAPALSSTQYQDTLGKVAVVVSAQEPEMSLEGFVRDKGIQESLRDRVVAAAAVHGARLATVSPAGVQDKVRGRDYRPLSAKSVDTVLEVALTKVGTEAIESASNPLMILRMDAHVQLIRTSDNSMIFSADYAHEAGRFTRSQWVASDAERLRQALQAGYETLGTHIYENVFLLYPFPDREEHGSGLNIVYGLAPIYPAWNTWHMTTVEQLRPTFRWQSFPRESDLQKAPEEMRRVKNVRYDLVIVREPRERGLAPEVIYRREGLPGSAHTLETSLDPATQYRWTVRARFELDGRERLTEWGTCCTVWKAPSSRTVSSVSVYSFKTP